MTQDNSNIEEQQDDFFDEEAGAEDYELQDLAAGLSELSKNSDIPESVKDLYSEEEFEAEPEIFQNNEWITIILSVQSWLYPDAPIPGELPPEKIAEKIFSLLPPGDSYSCFKSVQGQPVELTEKGRDRLLSRVSRSLELKNSFLNALDEGMTYDEASKEWLEAWEEDSAQFRRPISELSATVDTWTIMNFRDLARTDKIDLNPSYQRDVVWSNKDSVQLIDSILRGIPLPSVIFLQGEDGKYQIVDGKQRVTTILRFIGAHPEGMKFVKSKNVNLDEFNDNFAKFIRKFHVTPKELSENFLPFRLSRFSQSSDPLLPLSRKYYSDIKNKKISHGKGQELVSELFESPSSPYRIPVIIYKNTNVQDIQQIFGIYNRQGVKLNAEELRNAVYHNLHITRLLLVLSGDRNEPEKIKTLVPFFPNDMQPLASNIGSALESRGFGTARFKRTKVLSWIVSIFLHEPNKSDDNSYVTPSTASHINAFLEHVQEKSQHPIRLEEKLLLFASDLESAILGHQNHMEAWPPRLRNKKGFSGKWEELPLVATTLATLILAASGNINALSDKDDILRDHLSTKRIPVKTQNKTQWQFIARIALDIIEKLDLDKDAIGQNLKLKYNYNCLNTLEDIASSESFDA